MRAAANDQVRAETMSELDRAWEAVNALGGWVSDNDISGQGYNDAISAALKEIEKLGGMDPTERLLCLAQKQ
jgi:hypothetical protein